MFVDASAIVAILTEEAEAQALAGTLESAREPITSPIAVWEAAASISRNRPATKAQRHKEKIFYKTLRALVSWWLNPYDCLKERMTGWK